jgi:hypothetical protein
MPKVVFEHWRDGECIKRFALSSAQKVEVGRSGAVCVVFPRGQFTLATGDELHFNLSDLVEVLSHAQQ